MVRHVGWLELARELQWVCCHYCCTGANSRVYMHMYDCIMCNDTYYAGICMCTCCKHKYAYQHNMYTCMYAIHACTIYVYMYHIYRYICRYAWVCASTCVPMCGLALVCSLCMIVACMVRWAAFRWLKRDGAQFVIAWHVISAFQQDAADMAREAQIKQELKAGNALHAAR